MMGNSVLLVALLGALLVAGSAAGPIRAVAEPKQPESQYVFVKLMFEGHDQPNFDRWHANATAATVAQVAGVPVNYLIRMVDGKIPGTDKSAPVPPPKKEDTFKPAVPAAPVQMPATAAPVSITTTTTTPGPGAATPAPAQAAAAPTVTLITAPAAKPAEPQPKAVQTKPESGEGEISQQQQQQQEQQQPPRRSSGFWNSVQQALSSSSSQQQQQQQQVESQPQRQEVEPAETAVDIRSSRGPSSPRVFVIGGRKLMGTQQLNPNQAMVEYAIKTNVSEPWAVRETVKRKLMASAAGFGMAQGTSLRGFYTLLKEHGVGYYPALWVDGEQILSGNVGLEAPANRFINGTTNKNFQHKLYKHTDLVKPKTPVARNATNVTISEPAFIMANRSTTTKETVINTATHQKSGLPAWAAALIALGAITVAIALAGTVWRCVRERRRRQEDDAAHSEPLSPHSVQ